MKQLWSKYKNRFIAFLILMPINVRSADTPLVTISIYQAQINTILKEVERQTGYYFTFTDGTVNSSRRINVSIFNAKIEKVLAIIFKDDNISWVIRGKAIVLQKRKSVETTSPSSGGQDSIPRRGVGPLGEISGYVKDEKGDPVIGASIVEKDGGVLGITNGNGYFRFTDVNVGTDIVFSHMGYNNLVWRSRVGEVQLAMSLKVTELRNVEVFSTGYQEITKNRMTGSVSKVDNELFNRQVGSDVLGRIKNVVSGLVENPPTSTRLRSIAIRGRSTFKNTDPLIVVDNFPFEGDLSSINPNDVESVTVLKDAAAAAVWGARAGNGVIVVATKKGAYNSKTKIDFVANVTMESKPNLKYIPRISSGDIIGFEKLQFEKGIYDYYDDFYASAGYFPALPSAVEILLKAKRDGVVSPTTDAKVLRQLSELEKGDVRDDLKKHFMRNGLTQQYAVNISGGTDRHSFYGSVGMDRQLPVAIKSNSDRFTFNLNNIFKVSEKLDFGTQIFYIRSSADVGGTNYDAILAGQQVSTYSKLIDDNGRALPIPMVYRIPYVDTARYPRLMDWYYRPYDEIDNVRTVSHSVDTRINLNGRYKIFPWLKAEMQYQWQTMNDESRTINNIKSFAVRDGINRTMSFDNMGRVVYPWPLGSLVTNTDFVRKYWNARGSLVADKQIGRHRINGIAGLEYRELQGEAKSSTWYGYDEKSGTFVVVNPTEQIPTRPNGVIVLGGDPSPNQTLERYGSIFTNLIYNYQEKYFISASARIDQSNNFGIRANLRKRPLWSIGAGWAIHEESFYHVSWLSLLKLRSSFGFTGNSVKGATSYATMSYRDSEIYAPFRGIRYAGILTPNNPGLRWEKIQNVNIGLDFGLFKERVTGSIDFYGKKGVDLIGPVNLDPTTGFTTYEGNQSAMKSKGLDLVLSFVIMDKRDIKWDARMLLSVNKDKVTRYYTPSQTIMFNKVLQGDFIEGYSATPIFSTKFAGLNSKDGSPQIFSADTVSSTDNAPRLGLDDFNYHGSSVPRVFGSLMNTFSWKNISVSANISYKFRYFFRRSSISYGELLTQGWNTHKDYALRWTKSGDEAFTNVPSLPEYEDTYRDQAYQYSDVLVEKGDHIRLQDVRINYNLPPAVLRKLRLSLIQVFAYASDLGIIWRANSHGIDPDASLYGQLPATRRYSFGVNATF